MSEYTPEEEEAWEALEVKANPDTSLPTIPGAIQFGSYALWDVDSESFGITNVETGEGGVFPKAEFEQHVTAFFGLNF